MKKHYLLYVMSAIVLIWTVLPARAESTAAGGKTTVGESETGRYIVVLKDPPVAMYDGGLPGLAATRARDGRKLDLDVAAAEAYQDYLTREQDEVLAEAGASLGRSVEVEHRYTVVLNGFAARFSREEANQAAGLAGVAFVQPEQVHLPLTDAGPEWIGAEAVWGGLPGDPAAKGEGVIVGVIDTGVNPLNPSFLDPGPGDGYNHANPLGKYVGVCDPENPAHDPLFTCNDKLIGAWDFTPRIPGNPVGPLDVNGHGSHTASTAAGNMVNAAFTAAGDSFDRTISGVAPHANIIAYRGCYPDEVGGCPNLAAIAAMEQAVKDGVDVINYSIGGSSRDPWRDAIALAFLAVRNAGVFVAASAGNSGPSPQTSGSPSNAPWIMSVGASTHNRALLNVLTELTSDGGGLPNIQGQGMTSGLAQAPIVYAGAIPNPAAPAAEPLGFCCTPYPEGSLTGRIVVCDRGTCGRVEKSENVKAGGAVGFVLVNDAPSAMTLLADAFALPGAAVSPADGEVLKTWLASSANTRAALTGVQVDIDDSRGDVMASFSSRGPDLTSPDVIKPDVAAPGVNILAADRTNGEIGWGVMSGTSMASPHAAGAAALIRQSRPDWTPAEVQSALMMTGLTDLLQEDLTTPAGPFDRGAGRVQVNRAPLAGLIMEETHANYLAADPGTRGDPSTLNIPSLARNKTVIRHSWKRTVKNPTTAVVAWTVTAAGGPALNLTASPNRFTLAAGQTRDITVTAQVVGGTLGEWLFGRVDFTAGGQTPLYWPAAVRPVLATIEPSYKFSNVFRTGAATIEQVQFAGDITNFTAAVFGMTPAEEFKGQVRQDPTPTLPFDGQTPEEGLYLVKKVLTAGVARLTAEIFSAASPDLNLYIQDINQGVTICSSNNSGSLEYCNVDNLAPGEYWIAVQNVTASDAAGLEPDSFTLGVAAVPGDASTNAGVGVGPAAQASDAPNPALDIPAGDPFNININYDLTTQSRHWYGGFIAGADPDNPADIGRVNIDIVHNNQTLPVVSRDEGGRSGCFIGAVE
ncbi:MAG: S8 family serine peptidase [Pseudomonadota bacterium]